MPDLTPIGDVLVSFEARVMTVEELAAQHQEITTAFLSGKCDATWALHRMTFLCLVAIEGCRQLEGESDAPTDPDRRRGDHPSDRPDAAAPRSHWDWRDGDDDV